MKTRLGLRITVLRMMKWRHVVFINDLTIQVVLPDSKAERGPNSKGTMLRFTDSPTSIETFFVHKHMTLLYAEQFAKHGDEINAQCIFPFLTKKIGDGEVDLTTTQRRFNLVLQLCGKKKLTTHDTRYFFSYDKLDMVFYLSCWGLDIQKSKLVCKDGGMGKNQ